MDFCRFKNKMKMEISRRQQNNLRKLENHCQFAQHKPDEKVMLAELEAQLGIQSFVYASRC